MKINELLGIRYPILQGGMANIASGAFAAAVSNAGAMGTIGSGGMRPEVLEREIEICREKTDLPFAVNIVMLSRHLDALIDVVIKKGVRFVTVGAGSPFAYMDRFRENGVKVLPLVSSPSLARRLERSEVAAVIAEGSEAGGHIGEMTTMTLIPQTIEQVSIPVIAAGGIANGRQMLAAEVLGASGVQLGTAFLFTEECPLHPAYKEAILKANASKITVIGSKEEEIESVLKEVCKKDEAAFISNINSAKQVVISGRRDAVDKAAEVLKQSGARILPLKVSGPFHTPYMNPAIPVLRKKMESMNFLSPQIPVFTNVTGKAIDPDSDLRENLLTQMVAPVRLYDCLKRLRESGVERFVEIGSGNVMSSMIKKEWKEVETIVIEDVNGLNAYVDLCRAESGGAVNSAENDAKDGASNREEISENSPWAIVTGAAGGIGQAICKDLAENGWNLALIVRKEDERSAALEKAISERKRRSFSVAADISDWQECETAVATVLSKTGRIDALVNNAGVTRDNLVLRMRSEDFDTVIRTNLHSAFYFSKLVFPQMMKARSGRIVNITSYVGIHGNIAQANYAAAKAGMIGMTKSMAKEFASRGVCVNAVAPGFIESPMTDVLSDKVKEGIFAQIPLKQFGTPADIAHMVTFLLSDKARYITGQTFSVDGGMSI